MVQKGELRDRAQTVVVEVDDGARRKIRVSDEELIGLVAEGDIHVLAFMTMLETLSPAAPLKVKRNWLGSSGRKPEMLTVSVSAPLVRVAETAPAVS